MSKKRNDNWIKVTIYSFLLVVVSFFLLVSVDLLYKSINPSTQKQELTMAYNTENKISYSISTFDTNISNDYETGMNQKYISKVVDKIIFNIGFEYDASKQIDLDYEYKVDADIISEYNGNKVWDRTVPIVLPTSNNLLKDNYLSINKTFSIDYQEYEELVKQVEEESNLDLTSYIDIKFYVLITSKELTKLNVQNIVDIRVSLGEELTSVTYTGCGKKSDNIWEEVDTVESSNIFVKIVYSLITLVLILIEMLLLFKLAKVTSKDRYVYEIEGAFKLYGDILVEVDSVPEHKKLGKIEITNFTDLVDVSKKLCLPILYKKMGEDYYFFVMTDKYFYSYIVRRRFFYKKMSE